MGGVCLGVLEFRGGFKLSTLRSWSNFYYSCACDEFNIFLWIMT